MIDSKRVTTWRAVILNTALDLDGDRFTPDALRQMINGVESCPVTVEFKHDIGEATDFVVTDGQEIACVMTLRTDVAADAVPVVSFRHEGMVSGGYQSPRLLSVGLTTQPATMGTWMEELDAPPLDPEDDTITPSPPSDIEVDLKEIQF